MKESHYLTASLIYRLFLVLCFSSLFLLKASSSIGLSSFSFEFILIGLLPVLGFISITSYNNLGPGNIQLKKYARLFGLISVILFIFLQVVLLIEAVVNSTNIYVLIYVLIMISIFAIASIYTFAGLFRRVI